MTSFPGFSNSNYTSPLSILPCALFDSCFRRSRLPVMSDSDSSSNDFAEYEIPDYAGIDHVADL